MGREEEEGEGGAREEGEEEGGQVPAACLFLTRLRQQH
jgi:hypothetical protein